MSLLPPDYVEPVAGWRIWTVVMHEGDARLMSPVHFELWEPGAAFTAECEVRHRDRHRPWRVRRPRHQPPADGCTCGVYGLFAPGPLGHYFRWTVAGPRVHYHVVGRVSLWGEVVEGTEGWRASHGYPAELWLPQMDYHIAHGLGFDRVRDDLAAYGVTVNDCRETPPRALIDDLAEATDTEKYHQPVGFPRRKG